MRKTRGRAAAAAVVLAAVLGTSGAAVAADLGGRFGVGGEVNLIGLGGLSLKKWFGDSLRLGILGGYQRILAFDPASAMPEPKMSNRIVLELQGLYVLAGDDLSHLGVLVGVGADLLTIPQSIAIGVVGEVGLSGEVLLSDYFAIHASAGLGLSIANSRIVDNTLLREIAAISFGAAVGFGPSLSAGFTWYFDAPSPSTKKKKTKKADDEDDEEEEEEEEDEEGDDEGDEEEEEEEGDGEEGDDEDDAKTKKKDKKDAKKDDKGADADKGDKGDKGDEKAE